jgi:hypothetical protein
MQQKKLYPKNT